MSSYIEIKAANLDDALTKAMLELSASSEELEYEVIQEATAGFFGIGAKKTAIRVRKKEPSEMGADAPKGKKKKNKTIKAGEKKARQETRSHGRFDNPDRVARPMAEEEDNTASVREKAEPPVKREREVTPIDVAPRIPAAEAFLQSVFAAMHLEAVADIRVPEEINTMEIELSGSEMGVLIGKRGQTLDALQYLTGIVVNAGQSEYIRVKLDTENYRARRKQTLENLAKNIASKVKRTGRSVSLEPMNAYERRIIHSCLQPEAAVETHSEGEDPYRKVVVSLADGYEPRPERGRRGNRYGKPYHCRQEQGYEAAENNAAEAGESSEDLS